MKFFRSNLMKPVINEYRVMQSGYSPQKYLAQWAPEHGPKPSAGEARPWGTWFFVRWIG